MHRSLLFVPGDRPDRFDKAAVSGADALILDLEDAVVPDRKSYARSAVAEWLKEPRRIAVYVRINPLGSSQIELDLEAILSASPDALVLPKAEGASSIEALSTLAHGSRIPILPIATETPAAIFQLGSYCSIAHKLAGLTWGAEDLPVAMGAVSSREVDGEYTAPYELARSLTLFAAHACNVPAVETVFPAFIDLDGLRSYVSRARRDGFTGMLAIHPRQIETINSGFTPSDEEVSHAVDVVRAFESSEGRGAIQLNGKMLDTPHLSSARKILAMASTSMKKTQGSLR
ncbi:HpcH/HpaI aldolase/citrate lyase family protein [Rhizobium leguminosarum]|nr:citrate lyase [Rhizobium leguminosarum]